MRKINFVFAFDAPYIQHLCVCVSSLVSSNNDLIEKVYLVSAKHPQIINEAAYGYLENILDTRLCYIHLGIEKLKNFQPSGHVSHSTFSRIFLADLLPSHIDTACYIDLDTIINGSLNELAQFRFDAKDQFYIAAVDHLFSKVEIDKFNDKYNLRITNYFNAGVMLINIKLWKEKNVSQRSLEIIEKFNNNFEWWDQDILNIIFEGKWQAIDPSFNYFLEGIISKIESKSFIEPKIIHFAGNSKPWHYLNRNPYKYLYYKNLRNTPFNNYSPPDKNVHNFFKKYIIPKWIYSVVNFIGFYFSILINKIKYGI
jgi:lipopolysaccharide biosynthesis glycosyltransferase